MLRANGEERFKRWFHLHSFRPRKEEREKREKKERRRERRETQKLLFFGIRFG